MALAKRCDELGYHRYWVAEHHASDSLASSSPEILITRLAAETERIRVGSGGVMLSHYSPYKVAENFRMLEVLYPGRIDLGVGRAPGSDGLTAAALAYGNPLGIEYYPAKVKDLVAFVSGRSSRHRGVSRISRPPEGRNVAPDVDARFELRLRRIRRPLRPRVLPCPLHRAATGRRGDAAVPRAVRAGAPRPSPTPPSGSSPSPWKIRGTCGDMFRRMREIQRIRRDRGVSAGPRRPWRKPPIGRSRTRNSKPCAAVDHGRSSAPRTKSGQTSRTWCANPGPTKQFCSRLHPPSRIG